MRLKLLLILTILSYNCKAQGTIQKQINNYSTQIIGIWIDENDENYRLKFLTNNTCKEYEGTELLSTYIYSIEGSNCKNFSDLNTIYLKWIDNEDLQRTCFEILNVTEDTLSLMIIEKGKVLFFNKQ